MEKPNIIPFVNDLIHKAHQLRASDIHLEPQKSGLLVRYRIDGLLQDVATIPKSFEGAVLSRIKIIADMDIAEHRLPQDGRIHLKDREIDLRISTIPTIAGEKIVLRILDPHAADIKLEELGFAPDDLELFLAMVNRLAGLVLICGPTGSGKTTTLYAALKTLNRREVNIITIEDPVEYQLGSVTQVQVNYKSGLNFARGLRAILRQDPDIIMIGEIRDLETAKIAVQAALTGHLVLATLHTGDTVSAISRLADMGIEPFLISAALSGVVAQRLVRKIKRPSETDPIGYSGRTAVFEVLRIGNGLKELIGKGATVTELRRAAVNGGLVTLYQNGLKKVEAGISTQEEVMRAVCLDED